MADVVLTPELESLKQRLYSRVAVNGECVEFAGARIRFNYGTIGHAGKNLKAHRAAWMVHFGEIPAGCFVLHRCDNPPCINPAHLFLGTHKDNMRDMVCKRRQAVGIRQGQHIHPHRTARGERHGRHTLTSTEVEMIRLLDAFLKQRESAKLFGVCRSTIGRIIRRQYWAHV